MREHLRLYTLHLVDKLVLDSVDRLKRKVFKFNAATLTATELASEPTQRNTRLEKALLKVLEVARLCFYRICPLTWAVCAHNE